MSHRAEEKERRRQERLAAEQAAQRGDHRKRLALVGGVVLVIGIAAVLFLVLSGGSSEEERPTVAAPTFGNDNLAEAARAAGCEVTEHRIEGATHTGDTVRYRTNPPTSGDHDPQPAGDGEYEQSNPPDIEQSVHSLEHGRILIQYKKGTPQQRIEQLRAVFNESVKGTNAYKTLLFENQTNMEPALAATAWGVSLTCDAWNDRVFDAVRAFRKDYVDKGPEQVP